MCCWNELFASIAGSLLFAGAAIGEPLCRPVAITTSNDLIEVQRSLALYNPVLTPENMAKVRGHGWNLFARVTAAVPNCGGVPVFRTWRNRNDTFQSHDKDNGRRRKFPDDIKTPAAMFESVYFNPDSYHRVRDASEALYTSATLKDLENARRREIKEFPPGSVVVK